MGTCNVLHLQRMYYLCHWRRADAISLGEYMPMHAGLCYNDKRMKINTAASNTREKNFQMDKLYKFESLNDILRQSSSPIGREGKSLRLARQHRGRKLEIVQDKRLYFSPGLVCLSGTLAYPRSPSAPLISKCTVKSGLNPIMSCINWF